MKFNGQMRDLGYDGLQGREEMKGEEEKRVCGDLCKDKLASWFYTELCVRCLWRTALTQASV